MDIFHKGAQPHFIVYLFSHYKGVLNTTNITGLNNIQGKSVTRKHVIFNALSHFKILVIQISELLNIIHAGGLTLVPDK